MEKRRRRQRHATGVRRKKGEKGKNGRKEGRVKFITLKEGEGGK